MRLVIIISLVLGVALFAGCIIVTIITVVTKPKAGEHSKGSGKAPSGHKVAHMKQTIVIQECASNPCQNKGTCVELATGYRCKCPEGFSGDQCEKEVDECDSRPCLNGGTCTDLLNDFQCQCPSGYTGKQCGSDIDECESRPCKNNGTCTDSVNSYSCQCVAGYTGDHCEIDIDECESKPCKNNGTCTDSVNTYSCQCVAGYTGDHCEIEINECDSGPCKNGGNCTDLVHGYVCHCPSGYTGAQCNEEINWCESRPCLNNGTCTNMIEKFLCHCLDGFTGARCENEIDECESGPCKNKGNCTDLLNDYVCHCPVGYSGKQCEEEINWCKPKPCENGANCTNLLKGFQCQCLAGYTGDRCENEINWCESKPCQNGADCTSLLKGFQCQCKAGYTGVHCEIDINECDSQPCQNDARCIDIVNGYQCQCEPGFTGTHCEEEIDECQTNPCENNGTCTDLVNDFSCQCITGYEGKRCQEVPYDVDIKMTAEKFVKEMENVKSQAYTELVEKFKPVIQAVCQLFSHCEVKHVREGSVVMEFGLTSPEQPHDMLENALHSQLPPDITGVELGEIHQHIAGPCETLTPCKNGGTCTDRGRKDFVCCCPKGWAGKICDEYELQPKPYGPHLECINDLNGDYKGLNYFGTRRRTTSGLKCQFWGTLYREGHQYYKELVTEENFCRNRADGTEGRLGPWCNVDDENKDWEYCDNIPYCSNPDEVFPEPPTSPGCYTRLDKGTSYYGPINFSKSGRRCAYWGEAYPDLSDNYCTNPGQAGNKPWCWTRDGNMEDCDIPICALPPPVPGANKCSVDTAVSVCDSKVVLKGHCHYEFDIDSECGFTVVSKSRRLFDVYMSYGAFRPLHWLGVHGPKRYTSRRCNAEFVVTDFGELTIRMQLCGWCAAQTLQSYIGDVQSNKKTCPLP